MSNELSIRPNQQIEVMPKTGEDVINIARMISEGGFAPRGNDKPNQIIASIQKGLEVGLTPMTAVQQIAVIGGRPTIWGSAMIGLVQASGKLEDMQEKIEGEGENMKAVCRVKRVDRKTETVREFSVEDAKTAGLWGKQGPWKQYPKRMLQMRARGFALNDTFPDVLNGLNLREEFMDLQAQVQEENPTEQQAVDVDWNEGHDMPTETTQGAIEGHEATMEPEKEPDAPQIDLLGDQEPEPEPIDTEETPDQKKLKDDAYLNAERGVDAFREWWKLISKQEQAYLKDCGLLPVLQETAQNA